MPTRRTTRKRVARRRPARSNNVRAIARQEAKKAVARTVESKTFDGAVATIGVDYTGTSTVWSATLDSSTAVSITQGVSESQYLGAWIQPTYLMIRGTVTLADTTNMIRFIVVQDRAAGVPTLANVLQSVGNARAPLSAFEVDYNSTYRVLADRLIALTVSDTFKVFKVKLGKKLLQRIHFNDAGGTLERGGIYMMAISDSAAAVHPSIQLYWRLHYKDA